MTKNFFWGWLIPGICCKMDSIIFIRQSVKLVCFYSLTEKSAFFSVYFGFRFHSLFSLLCCIALPSLFKNCPEYCWSQREIVKVARSVQVTPKKRGDVSVSMRWVMVICRKGNKHWVSLALDADKEWDCWRLHWRTGWSSSPQIVGIVASGLSPMSNRLYGFLGSVWSRSTPAVRQQNQLPKSDSTIHWGNGCLG